MANKFGPNQGMPMKQPGFGLNQNKPAMGTGTAQPIMPGAQRPAPNFPQTNPPAPPMAGTPAGNPQLNQQKMDPNMRPGMQQPQEPAPQKPNPFQKANPKEQFQKKAQPKFQSCANNAMAAANSGTRLTQAIENSKSGSMSKCEAGCMEGCGCKGGVQAGGPGSGRRPGFSQKHQELQQQGFVHQGMRDRGQGTFSEEEHTYRHPDGRTQTVLYHAPSKRLRVIESGGPGSGRRPEGGSTPEPRKTVQPHIPAEDEE
jgi:hypothetical protein